MYTPRSSDEITRDLVARMVARSDLTDISEGSALLALMRTVAEQIAEADVRLAQIRDQFTLEGASGVDLDERAEELGFTRLPATRATGRVTITRATTAGALVVPEGAVFGRSDDDEVTYLSTAEETFAIGVASIEITVRASVEGGRGNAPSSTINKLNNVVSDVVSVTQGVGIANGREAETDANLRDRATRHLNSLARCQPLALEYLATSYTATDGTRATTALIYELPEIRGECELLIDDGSGLGDAPPTRAGANVSVTLNSALGQVIGLEAPLASFPVVLNGSTPLIRGVDYVVAPERGLVHIRGGASVNVGDTLSVSGYTVYTGLIAELQRAIEGDPADVSSGYRPAGISVRVLPAPVQRVSLDILIAISTGGNLTTITRNVESSISAHLSALPAGSPAIMAALTSVVMDVDGVLNVALMSAGTASISPDIYPNTPRTVLRGETLRVITSTTGV